MPLTPRLQAPGADVTSSLLQKQPLAAMLILFLIGRLGPVLQRLSRYVRIQVGGIDKGNCWDGVSQS